MIRPVLARAGGVAGAALAWRGRGGAYLFTGLVVTTMGGSACRAARLHPRPARRACRDADIGLAGSTRAPRRGGGREKACKAAWCGGSRMRRGGEGGTGAARGCLRPQMSEQRRRGLAVRYAFRSSLLPVARRRGASMAIPWEAHRPRVVRRVIWAPQIENGFGAIFGRVVAPIAAAVESLAACRPVPEPGNSPGAPPLAPHSSTLPPAPCRRRSGGMAAGCGPRQPPTAPALPPRPPSGAPPIEPAPDRGNA